MPDTDPDTHGLPAQHRLDRLASRVGLANPLILGLPVLTEAGLPAGRRHVALDVTGRWRIGRRRFGPPQATAILIATETAEAASDTTLRGLISRGAVADLHGTATNAWWRSRTYALTGAVVALLGLTAVFAHEWAVVTLLSVPTVLLVLLGTRWARLDHAHDVAAAAQLAGAEAVAAAQWWIDLQHGARRHLPWPLRIFTVELSSKQVYDLISRYGRKTRPAAEEDSR